MKRGTDTRLKRLMQEHPIEVVPTKKEAFLEAIREMERESEKERGGYGMKKQNWKPVFVIAAMVLCLTMLLSAGALVYYYRIPGGEFVDEVGQVLENPAETDSTINDRSIRIGENLTIAAVTWAQAENHTTLAVWVDGDSVELENLVAVVDGVEYPLEKKTFHLGGGQVGYTAVDVPKPVSLVLRCDSPFFKETITFSPEDIMTEATVGNVTLFGSAAGNTLYIGVSDSTYLDSPIFEHAELSLIMTDTGNSYVMDNEGNTYQGSKGGSTTRSDSFLTFQQYDIPAGNHIIYHYTDAMKMIYFYPQADAGKSPRVKLPLPAVGESLEGSWVLLDDDGISCIISKITRQAEDTVIITVPDGVVVNGVKDTGASCMPGLVRTDVADPTGTSMGVVSGGGGDTYDIRVLDGTLDDWTNEKGEITVCIHELRLEYIGEWELDFVP